MPVNSVAENALGTIGKSGSDFQNAPLRRSSLRTMMFRGGRALTTLCCRYCVLDDTTCTTNMEELEGEVDRRAV